MKCGKCGKNQRGAAENGVCKCPGQIQARDTDKRAYLSEIARRGSKKKSQLEKELVRSNVMLATGRRVAHPDVDCMDARIGSDGSG